MTALAALVPGETRLLASAPMLNVLAVAGSSARSRPSVNLGARVAGLNPEAWIVLGVLALSLLALFLAVRAFGSWYRRCFTSAMLPAMLGGFLALGLCIGDLQQITLVLGRAGDLYAQSFWTAATTSPMPVEPATDAINFEDDSVPDAPAPGPGEIAWRWCVYIVRNLYLMAILRIVILVPLMVALLASLVAIDAGGIRAAVLAQAIGAWVSPRRDVFTAFLLFATSIYLSLAALSSFPWFRDNTLSASDVRGDTLRTELDTMAVFPRSSVPPRPGVQYLQALRDSTTAHEPRLDTSARDFLSDIAGRSDALWDIASSRAMDLERDARYEQSVSKQVALERYVMSTQMRMSLSERAIFEIQIKDWYRHRSELLARRVRGGRAVLDLLKLKLEDWSSRAVAAARGPRGVAATDSLIQVYTRRREQIAGNWMINGPEAWYRRRSQLFDLDTDEVAKLGPPQPGEELGPFGLLSRWLLRTRSEGLAALTGMLGFGLFGAMVASFVRGPGIAGIRTRGGWSMVLVRGFSAAMVVYLGVQGGLSVFTSSERGINPYSLCLACFIGAVFSEGVWSWARKRVREWGGEDDEGPKRTNAARASGTDPEVSPTPPVPKPGS